MRKNKRLIAVLSGLAVSTIIVFVVIPLLINFLFQKQAPVNILAARWNAAEALNYLSIIHI